MPKITISISPYFPNVKSWGTLFCMMVLFVASSSVVMADFATHLPTNTGVWAGFDINCGGSPTYTDVYGNAYTGIDMNGKLTGSGTSNGITLNVTQSSASNARTRSLTSSDISAMTTDFVFENGGSDNVASSNVQVSLSGLTANTDYTLRIYSFDTGSDNSNYTIYHSKSENASAVYSSTSNTTQTILRNVGVQNTAYVDIPYTSNSDGKIDLVISSNGGTKTGLFNGLEIVQTPTTVPIAKIDVNSNYTGTMSATLSSYNSMNFDNATLSQTVKINSDISITTTRISSGNHRDRSKATTYPTGDAVTNDFIYESGSNTISSVITGLEVGKTYELKVFSKDTDGNDSSAGKWSLTQGDTTTVVREYQYNLCNKASTLTKSTDSLNYFTTWFTATSDTATLKGVSASGLLLFNGLELNQVYEVSDGLTRFDITSDHKDGAESRVVAAKATEVYVKNGAVTSASGTAPSGITLTVSATKADGSAGTLSSRTRNVSKDGVEMNMYSDFLFSTSKDTLNAQLDGLTKDTLYRMTVYAVDTSNDQSAGIWNLYDSNDSLLFTNNHVANTADTSTWSFNQLFNSNDSTSVKLTASIGSKDFTMFNGLQLQKIDLENPDYIWSAPDNSYNWNSNYWKDALGNLGTPQEGDVCLVANRWIREPGNNATFAGTLVIGTGGELIMGYESATVNDLILDGGGLHQGSNTTPANINGNIYINSDSYIDLDDSSYDRTVQINSVISGDGGLKVNGISSQKRTLILTADNASYTGTITLNNAILQFSGNGTLGRGSLDIPSGSSLTLNGQKVALANASALKGAGTINVTETSFLSLGTADEQTFSGTINVSKDKALHIGSQSTNDYATELNLANATVSLVNGATLGLVQEDASKYTTTFTIGTLKGEAGSIVRASGSVDATKNNNSTLIVGQGDFAGTIGTTTDFQKLVHLVKNTDGTLTLSGENTYAGGTEIQAGTLKLTGNGTLGSGSVSIAENGTLEIDFDLIPTTTTIGSNLTVASDGKLDYVFSEDKYGTIDLGGELNLSDKAIRLSFLSPDSEQNWFDGLTGDGYQLIAMTGNEYLLGGEQKVDLSQYLDTTGLNQNWGLTGLPTGLYLTAAPQGTGVPEPSTWALLLLGFAGLMKVASCELRVARKRERR